MRAAVLWNAMPQAKEPERIRMLISTVTQFPIRRVAGSKKKVAELVCAMPIASSILA
jgi:hypothetical protein